MEDFICEERHSSRRPAGLPGGFVAEMRPSSRRVIPPRLPRANGDESAAFRVQDDQSFVNLVSNKSKQEYTDILTDSIIKLVQTLLTGHSIATIDGSVHVSFHGHELPVQVKLNECFPLAKNDLQLDLEKDMGIKICEDRSPPMYANCDGDHFHYNNAFSPDIIARDDFSSVTSSPPRTEQMTSDFVNDPPIEAANLPSISGKVSPSKDHESSSSSDSGEESGYLTSSLGHLSDGFADGALKRESQVEGKAGQSYGFGPKRFRSGDVGSDELDHPLIIDVANVPRDGSDGMETDVDHKQEEKNPSEDLVPVPEWSQEAQTSSSSSDDSENNLPSTSSDDADSDVPMDLSGDCKIIVAPESVSQEQDKKAGSPRMNHSLKCKLCSHISPDMNALSKHALRTHQVYTCDYCSRVFTAKNNLKRHIRIHTGMRPYKCSQCSTTFARRDDLKGHQLRHDYNKPFRCSLCKKGYTDRACVKNHMVKEHGSRLMYVCPQCGESFDREDAFSGHKKTHPELVQYACDICPFIGFNNLMACKHSLLHTRKLFSCKPCNAYFADPFGYTDHIRKHKKNEKFVSYVCCFCDIILPTYEQFVRHEYSHANCKTHVCHICNKQFRSKVLIQEHLQSHNDSANSTLNEKQLCGLSSAEEKDVMEIQLVETNCEGKAKDHDMEQDEAQDKHLNCQDEVLDLTMKRAVASVDHNQCINGAQSPSNGSETMSTFDVPRNGCVSDIPCPRQEERAQRCVVESMPRFEGRRLDVESMPRFEGRHLDEKSEAYLGAVRRNEMEQQRTAMASNHRSPGGNDQSDRRHFHDAANFDIPRQSVLVAKPSQQIQAQRKYSPYPLKSKGVELASKFMIARGRTPFTHNSPMRDLNKGLPAIPVEMKELVIEKDSTGRASLHVVTRPLQANGLFSEDPRVAGKENTDFRSLSLTGKDVEQEQALPSSVVYGLTGKEYRKESQPSPSFLPLETPKPFFQYVKSEPVDANNPSLESLRCDNIPEPVSSSALKTSPKADCAQACDLCAQTFENFSQLESHSVLTHKRYMCEYCGKGFTSRPNRDRHVRYHTGERPYKCDLCDTAFHRGDDLKYHRTTRHPEALPFVCTRCSASFTWKRDLDRHIRHAKCKV